MVRGRRRLRVPPRHAEGPSDVFNSSIINSISNSNSIINSNSNIIISSSSSIDTIHIITIVTFIISQYVHNIITQHYDILRYYTN